jgi:hypothetical protein
LAVLITILNILTKERCASLGSCFFNKVTMYRWLTEIRKELSFCPLAFLKLIFSDFHRGWGFRKTSQPPPPPGGSKEKKTPPPPKINIIHTILYT